MPANATSFFGSRERRLRGPRDDRPVHLETRSVAWAVPRPLGVVPSHETAHMGAYGGASRDGAGLVAIDRHPLSLLIQDATRAARNGPHRRSLGTGHPVANQIVRVILVSRT